MKNKIIFMIFFLSLRLNSAPPTHFPAAKIIKMHLMAHGFEAFARHTSIVKEIAEKDTQNTNINKAVSKSMQDFFDDHKMAPALKDAVLQRSKDLAIAIEKFKIMSKL